MSITGSVTIRLYADDENLTVLQSADRRALLCLAEIPDGAAVTVDIGERRYVSADAARWLHEHIDRLHLRIDGTKPEAVADFVKAARDGYWSVV
ncbi:hypothetical protein BH11ACT8_BH11ACT8_04340 [soil metagenome]